MLLLQYHATIPVKYGNKEKGEKAVGGKGKTFTYVCVSIATYTKGCRGCIVC